MEEGSKITNNLQALVNEVVNSSANTDVTEELIDNMLEVMRCVPKLDFNTEHKNLIPKLDQCAVSLWNAAVSKKTGGDLSHLLNAKLRHIACNLVYLCNSEAQHAPTLKKQTMMALKTARAWLDANDPTMCENPLSVALDCVEKRFKLLIKHTEEGRENVDSDSYKSKTLEINKDKFRYLCYKAESLCGQEQHDAGFELISQAKEIVKDLPGEGAYLSLLCYNFGVDSFQKAAFASSVQWLRESFELGKGISAVGCKNQARTLRLLAHAYLDWDKDVHWQKALNSIGLANAEYPHPAGLYLKVRILLEGKESDERLKTGLADVLRHPDLTVDLGLNTIKLIAQHDRDSVTSDGLKQLAQRFQNTPHAGQVSVAQLEILTQAGEIEKAKTLVENIITGDKTGNPLDVSIRKQIHLIIWEQASAAYEKNDHKVALEWYNYSLSLYTNTELKDSNLAKLHRNRASCHLQLEQLNEAEDAALKAETCDPESPYTYYIKYKIGLLKGEDDVAISSLQKMGNCETKKTSDAVDMEIDGIEHVKPKPSADVIHGLICLAAQLAFDRNNRSVAMQALESIVLHSSDPQQVLTALRCLIRLKLTLQEEENSQSENMDLCKIVSYIKSAYEKLVNACDKPKTGINVQQEAMWFMKMAWNMGLKCEEMYSDMQSFFVLCSQLQLLCPMDSGALTRHKTCLLMAAATGLQISKATKDEMEKRDALKQTLNFVSECREILAKIDKVRVTETDSHGVDNTTPVLLVLYEFEAKARLGDTDLEQVLERALSLPHCEAKAFETIAALAIESRFDQHGLSTRALKLAIKKHLQCDPVNFTACSKAFHSLIDQALQGGSHTDPASREEVWAYYLDVVDLVEQKAKGEYPETEVLWLMTKAWNCGIHLYSATKYRDALQWCELALKLLKYVGQHRSNYEKQMSSVYAEILAKVDSASTGV